MESSRSKGKSLGLQPGSKRVSNSSRTVTFTIELIRLEKAGTPLSLSSCGLDIISAVLLLKRLWHSITHEG